MSVQKADDGVHRLENLEVKEVSLVTRPANKRVFAVVKSEDGITPLPVADSTPAAPVHNGASNVVVEPALASVPTDVTKTGEQAQISPEPVRVDPAGVVPTPVVLISDPAVVIKTDDLVSVAAQTTTELNPVVASVVPQLGPLNKRFSDMFANLAAGKVNDPLELSQAANEASSIALTLNQIASQMNPNRPASNPYELSLGKSDTATPAPELDEVKKLGAKMAKERLERMRQAMQIMNELVTELSASVEEKADAVPGVFANKAEAPASEAALAEIKQTLDAAVAKSAKLEADLAETQKTLAAQTTENASLKKQVEEQSAALTNLAKTRGGSNALPSDTAGAKPQAAPVAEPVWAFDLNSNRGRNVKPEHQFTVADGK